MLVPTLCVGTFIRCSAPCRSHEDRGSKKIVRGLCGCILEKRINHTGNIREDKRKCQIKTEDSHAQL
jgi:hypothetical protein